VLEETLEIVVVVLQVAVELAVLEELPHLEILRQQQVVLEVLAREVRAALVAVVLEVAPADQTFRLVEQLALTEHLEEMVHQLLELLKQLYLGPCQHKIYHFHLVEVALELVGVVNLLIVLVKTNIKEMVAHHLVELQEITPEVMHMVQVVEVVVLEHNQAVAVELAECQMRTKMHQVAVAV
jgi:hypothetical protein